MSGVEIGGHDHPAWDAAVRQLQPADPAGNAFLIALGRDGTVIGTVRFRIPDPPDTTMTVRIGLRTLQTLRHGGWVQTGRLVAVAYGPPVLAAPVISITAAAAAQAGVDMYDMVRVREGRAWSYLCPEEDHRTGGPGLPVDPVSDTAIELATVLEYARDQEPPR